MTQQATLIQVLEENAKQKEEISSLRQSLTFVEEQLAWFKRQIFGPR